MFSENPKISVILTVFDGERYLSEAIDSVLAQSLSDFELIVVDDCSSDQTAEILEGYKQADQRVRIVSNTTNMGPYPSANAGLKVARANLIARMDADDICVNDRLERQLDFMDRYPDCLLVGGGYQSIDENGSKRFTRYNPMDFQTCSFVARLRMPFVHPSFCFRRLLPCGTPAAYDVSVPIAGDYALAARLGSIGPVASLDGLVVLYRMHESNISSTRLSDQRHFAHRAAVMATAVHYPEPIARDLRALLDVYYGKKKPDIALLKRAVLGLNAAIDYDISGSHNPAIVERAAGILAEAFAKQLPVSFAIHCSSYLAPLAKRFGRLKNLLPQISD